MFLTCSITELGFVRIIGQIPDYEPDVPDARELLSNLKANGQLTFAFLTDDNDISRLPAWVKAPKQVTDGHLLELATSHNAALATLDSKIPSAFLIP